MQYHCEGSHKSCSRMYAPFGFITFAGSWARWRPQAPLARGLRPRAAGDQHEVSGAPHLACVCVGPARADQALMTANDVWSLPCFHRICMLGYAFMAQCVSHLSGFVALDGSFY